MEKQKRNSTTSTNPTASPVLKDMSTSLEAYKLKLAAKRKSSDLEPLKEATLTKCAKTSNSFGADLESDDLIAPAVKQVTSTNITQSRDPRLKESRDPRLKSKSTAAVLNENTLEAKKGESGDKEEIQNKAGTYLILN